MSDDVASQQQVPYIQSSDLNDADILSGTAKLAGPNGTIVLRYTFADGTQFNSEPVQAELIGKAMLGWIDAVKNAIVMKAQEAADAANEGNLRRAREAAMAGPSLDDFVPKTPPTDRELAKVGVHMPATTPPSEPPVAVPANYAEQSPKAYAKDKVRELKESARMLRKSIKQRQDALIGVEKSLAEWTGVVAGLTRKRS